MTLALLLAPTLAAIPGFLIWLVIIGLCLLGAYYIIHNLFPPPMQRYAWVVIVVIAIILLILLLIPLAQGLS